MAAQQRKDVRGIAKAERERDRQERKAEKLAKRREAREQRQEPETRAGKGTAGGGAGEVSTMTNRGETLRTEDVWAAILGGPDAGDVLPPLSRAELLSVIMAIVHRLPDAAEQAVPDDPDSGPATF